MTSLVERLTTLAAEASLQARYGRARLSARSQFAALDRAGLRATAAILEAGEAAARMERVAYSEALDLRRLVLLTEQARERRTR